MLINDPVIENFHPANGEVSEKQNDMLAARARLAALARLGASLNLNLWCPPSKSAGISSGTFCLQKRNSLQ